MVVSDATSATKPSGGDIRQQGGPDLGRVQDIDLQHVVNGLWAAGAEAISINGQRLTARSAIRTAGSAINVDFRPLSPPYAIDAIGDPKSLAARFQETSDGRYLLQLKSQFGIIYEMSTKDALTLPAAAQLTVTDAVPVQTLFSNYFYFSSAIGSLVEHFTELAREVAQCFAPPGRSLAVEIGCNDGVLLKPLRALGVNALGVDPAVNVVRASGLPP